MTKMKSKKMSKSTFAIIIMGIVMVAMLAFGGTFAYFTAKASNVSGTVTTAQIHLTSKEQTFTMTGNYQNLLPKETVSATANLVNDSTRDSYVFVELTYGSVEGAFTLTGVTTTTDGVTWAKVGTEGNVYAAKVGSAVKDLVVTASFSFEADAEWRQEGTRPDAMAASIEVTIAAGSIQAQNGDTEFTDVAAAYAAYKAA